MDPHLRDLRYFVAVAEDLHFTNAARRLGIAQPTLSRQIRQLERQLETALFDRDQRTVALTVAGTELLAGARRILSQWDDTNARLSTATKTLRVGLQTALGQDLLQELQETSGQSLVFHTSPWTDPSCGLATRRSDVAVLWLPTPDPERYRWKELRSEDRWLLMPDTHRLVAKDVIDLADLYDEPFVALPVEAGVLRDFWLATDARGGRKPVIGAEASSAEETVEAVGLGLGVCIVAEGNVALYRWPGLTARRVTGVEPGVLAVAWRADEEREAVLDFVGHVLED